MEYEGCCRRLDLSRKKCLWQSSAGRHSSEKNPGHVAGRSPEKGDFLLLLLPGSLAPADNPCPEISSPCKGNHNASCSFLPYCQAISRYHISSLMPSENIHFIPDLRSKYFVPPRRWALNLKNSFLVCQFVKHIMPGLSGTGRNHL